MLCDSGCQSGAPAPGGPQSITMVLANNDTGPSKKHAMPTAIIVLRFVRKKD